VHLPAVARTARGEEREAGVDADAHGDAGVVEDRLALDLVQDREAGAHRALRIVAVRGRIAEIHDDAIAQVRRDVPAEGCDRRAHRLLVRIQYLAQVLTGRGARRARSTRRRRRT
jgi:hypothetical protein